MEDELVTIMTFSLPGDTAVLCSILDNEGIFYFLQDELTVQVNPLYSPAVGGIKLQVRKEDVEKAVSVLKKAGFYKEENNPVVPKFYLKLTKFLSKIPFIKNIYK